MFQENFGKQSSMNTYKSSGRARKAQILYVKKSIIQAQDSNLNIKWVSPHHKDPA